MGWRYLLFTVGAVSLTIFILRFFVFTFRETPKFSLFKGNNAKAIETLHHMAKINGRECRLTMEILDAVEKEHVCNMTDASSASAIPNGPMSTAYLQRASSELGRFKILFSSPRMARLTVLTWLTYILDFWGFTVAGFYLPRILALKNGAASVSLKFTYAAYIYTYAPGILGVLLGALSYRLPFMGRKWTMVLSSGLMGTAICLLSTVDTVAKNEGLFTLQYFFQSMFNAVLYGWTPEAFPAPIRGTACGVASFWGRLFGIVAPLVAQHLYGATDGTTGHGDINSVLYLAGGMTLGCVITTALLPSKQMEAQDEHS